MYFVMLVPGQVCWALPHEAWRGGAGGGVQKILSVPQWFVMYVYNVTYLPAAAQNATVSLCD